MAVTFDFGKYDKGGMNAIAGDGKLTGDEVTKAKKDGWNVFENYKEEDGTPKMLKNSNGKERLDAIVERELFNAPKAEDGSISRKDAIQVLLNICKQHNGTVTKQTSTKKAEQERVYNDLSRSDSDLYSYGYGYGYGFGYGGFLSEVKLLFDLYTDKDSPEGGENITPGEQQEIMTAVTNWMNDLLGQDKNIK